MANCPMCGRQAGLGRGPQGGLVAGPVGRVPDRAAGGEGQGRRQGQGQGQGKGSPQITLGKGQEAGTIGFVASSRDDPGRGAKDKGPDPRKGTAPGPPAGRGSRMMQTKDDASGDNDDHDRGEKDDDLGDDDDHDHGCDDEDMFTDCDAPSSPGTPRTTPSVSCTAGNRFRKGGTRDTQGLRTKGLRRPLPSLSPSLSCWPLPSLSPSLPQAAPSPPQA